eukprot:scaffold3043_cov180-Amphora_coffeaeformis.AAC.10
MSSCKPADLLKRPSREDENILPTNNPKNLRQGVKQGVGNILGAAVGTGGVAVFMPYVMRKEVSQISRCPPCFPSTLCSYSSAVGASAGARKGGVVGGVLGFGGGAVTGVVGAAGAVSGVIQVGKGVAAVPKQVVASMRGKWWSENEGRWVLTNMQKEIEGLKGVPEDDSDILGGVRAALDQLHTNNSLSTDVVDTVLYDALKMSPDADQSTIKRRYYVLARKYHPDKHDDGHAKSEASEYFKHISEAYHILSDPDLREKYNKMGRDVLHNDPSELTPEPKILFAFWFGSDKFRHIFGNLATAMSTTVGDSELITEIDARKIQKRRVPRLASKLIERITPWFRGVEGGAIPTGDGLLLQEWKKEAEDLCSTSFGYPLVKTVGEAYSDFQPCLYRSNILQSTMTTLFPMKRSYMLSVFTIWAVVGMWMTGITIVSAATTDERLSTILDQLTTNQQAKVANRDIPFVSLCFAQSLDGKLAMFADEESSSASNIKQTTSNLAISGASSLLLTHALRSAHEGILIGGRTMSTDNPRLSNRLWKNDLSQPRTIVLDPFLRHIQMLGEGRKARNIIVCCSDKVELPEHSHRDITFLPCRTCYDGSLDLVDVLINLRRYHGIKSVMVEGGPTLLGKFLEAQLFDAACVTIAPETKYIITSLTMMFAYWPFQKGRDGQTTNYHEESSSQFSAGLKMIDLHEKLKNEMKAAQTDEERAQIAKEVDEAATGLLLRASWTTTVGVVDITSTLYEACQMIFSINLSTRTYAEIAPRL